MPQTLLLDTHCWLWWKGGDLKKFSPRCKGQIERAILQKACFISAISVWELGMLIEKRRVVIDTTLRLWTLETVELSGIKVAEMGMRAALESAEIGAGLHGDPADRLIVGTARVLGAKLVSADGAIAGLAARGLVEVMEPK